MMEGMQNNQMGQQAGQSEQQTGATYEQPATATEQPVQQSVQQSVQQPVQQPVEQPVATISGTLTTIEDKKREAMHMALELARQVSDWETFFRGMMGSGGVIEQLFPVREERLTFMQMPEYLEIQRIMARLRETLSKRSKPDREITRVITVRLPESLHSALMLEANDLNTSMNKLCISKLLQVIDDDLVC